MKRLRRVTWLPVLGLVATGLAISGPAEAFGHVATVRVTIERVEAMGCLDGSTVGTTPEGPRTCAGAADFFAVVQIGEQSFSNRDTPESLAFVNQDVISPNWQFATTVGWSAGNVPVQIQIWDRDSALFGLFLPLIPPISVVGRPPSRFDDHVDINFRLLERDLQFGLDLAPCYVSDTFYANRVRGGCGTSIVNTGYQWDRARITFRVAVEPNRVQGLPPEGFVRCLHSPISPQPGQAVTITAESLSLSLQPAHRLRIEIWTGPFGPALTGEGDTLTYTRSFSADFVYLCRVVDESIDIMSSARRVRVGPTSSSAAAVPVLQSGARSQSVDIVFVPDQDDYTGPWDPNFLSAVSATINAFFSESLYLRNDRTPGGLNFWIATTMGDADPPPPGGGICPTVTRPDVSWADSIGVLHANSLIRDCAGGNTFSSWTGQPRIALHESGHRPFGLADEYCCDGGYWQPAPFPNVFADRSPDAEDCEADALALGPQAGACRTWVGTRITGDWFTHDPTGNDLMEFNQAPQLLDIRRITWVLNGCRFRAAC